MLSKVDDTSVTLEIERSFQGIQTLGKTRVASELATSKMFFHGVCMQLFDGLCHSISYATGAQIIESKGESSTKWRMCY